MSNDSIDNVTPIEDTDEDDDDDLVAPQDGGVVPVGITIAYLKQEHGFNNDEKMHHHHNDDGSPNSRSSSRSTAKHSKSTTKKQKNRRKSKSFQMFVESAVIYAICLMLPTLLAYFYSLYDAWNFQRQTGTTLPVEESLWYVYVASSPNYQYVYKALYRPTIDYLMSTTTYQWVSSSIYQPAIDYVCVDPYNDISSTASSSSYIWSLISYSMIKAGICPLPATEQLIARRRSVLSDDVSAYSDVIMIAICSFVLALIRIVIIRITVPIENSDTLEAMVRCKSVHLLSSDYVLTPVATPRKVRALSRVVAMNNGAGLPEVPTLFPNLPYGDVRRDDPMDDNEEMFGYNIDSGNSERESDDAPVRMQAFVVGAPLQELSAPLLSKPIEDVNELAGAKGTDGTTAKEGEDGFSAALFQSLTAAAAAAAAEEDDDAEGLSDSGTSRRQNRLYAAPRYATALFRLLYCSAATGLALLYFRDADFWPWFVLGHGQTAKCWDLSGGLTVGGMDSDFDQRNAVLKSYFLWQASYHWHSGAFHLLSVSILMWHPTKHAPRRFLSFRRGSKAYLRSLFQHVLAVALIAAAYIFSSLRRLGAIGLFAFDVSSWFLHLLQVCINAPEDSKWRRHAVISRVYWCLVIPSFVLTRFLIWPAIWYSATFESKIWLLQLERTLWPGSATLLRSVFHCHMIIVHTMSIIYLRRLLNHPHLKRLLRPDVFPSSSSSPKVKAS